jgi:chloramphenicol 3-O-phosphotransferase
MFEGMYQAIHAFAAAGDGTIIDDVIFDRPTLAAAVQALHATNTLFDCRADLFFVVHE